MKKPYLQILSVEKDKRYASFYLCLPANNNDTDDFYVLYRFIYEINSYTPEEKLILHTQKYVVDGNCLRLKQDIEWVGDAKKIQAAYAPMLTAQRLNPERTEEILSDTVEFYGAKGELLTCFDTTPYKAGVAWKSDIFYRITYIPTQE